MKISIIGAGNVGGLTAMHLAESCIADLVLVDSVKGLARGKSFDLEDSAAAIKYNYNIKGTEDIKDIAGSDIVVVTAGLTRKPGMSREGLLNKNAQILKDICINIKKLASEAIVIVVTNPLDIMTYLALKITGFKSSRVFGMGITLDAARFSNLISKELNIANKDIEACVIGSHGEGMMPLSRFSSVKGVPLDKFIAQERCEELISMTVKRGAEIVSLLGSGSAYFAPSQAIMVLVRVIAKDEKRILGVSAYLNGEYGIKDVCLGVPCRIGKEGIEKIIELDLNKEEKEALSDSAALIKGQYKHLTS